MSSSYNKIWIHAIWATKYRRGFITNEIEEMLYENIRCQFIEMGCTVSIINGATDHIHCLFLMNPNKSIAEIIKQVKGNSSYLINNQKKDYEKFVWQRGYSAFSVSERNLNITFKYIRAQKEHHNSK